MAKEKELIINIEMVLLKILLKIFMESYLVFLESGANIKDIQQSLGHSKISTTMDTYSHVTNKLKIDSVNRFESLISSAK